MRWEHETRESIVYLMLHVAHDGSPMIIRENEIKIVTSSDVPIGMTKITFLDDSTVYCQESVDDIWKCLGGKADVQESE